MATVHDEVLAIAPCIRYVALASGQRVSMVSRPNLRGASSSESDRYEELLVNPALLTLARQRGEIDCGGLRYVIVGYGNFQQVVIPLRGGHASLAFELDAAPGRYLAEIVAALRRHGYDATAPDPSTTRE